MSAVGSKRRLGEPKCLTTRDRLYALSGTASMEHELSMDWSTDVLIGFARSTM